MNAAHYTRHRAQLLPVRANYRMIEARLKGLGLQMLSPDICKNYIPKQAFSQIPAIQTCFQFRNSQKIQTQYGELHVIYK